jgi:hypothetical protein
MSTFAQTLYHGVFAVFAALFNFFVVLFSCFMMSLFVSPSIYFKELPIYFIYKYMFSGI